MAYYRTCPYCGANLDPGERCDCMEKESAAAHAANMDNGKRTIQHIKSTSILHGGERKCKHEYFL